MTEVLECLGVSSPNQWILQAGADKPSAVNSPDDDATSYIRAYTGRGQQFTLQSSSIPAGSTINSVSIVSRGECPNAEYWKARLVIGANYTEGAQHSPLSWSSYTEALAKPGGGSWAQTDLSSLEVAIYAYDSPYTACACTTLYVLIDYTPPAATTGDMLLVF